MEPAMRNARSPSMNIAPLASTNSGQQRSTSQRRGGESATNGLSSRATSTPVQRSEIAPLDHAAGARHRTTASFAGAGANRGDAR